MISLLCSLGRKSLALLAVLIVCLLPAAVQAQAITLKNTTSGAVVVQTTIVFRGQVKAGPQFRLAAGATTPGITLPGNISLTIRDAAAPTNVLFRGPLPAGTAFDIVIAGNPPKQKMDVQPSPPKP